jgi:hypothetical protein
MRPLLKEVTSQQVNWPLEFWCVKWDADTLSGYIDGYIGIQTKPVQESIIFNNINEPLLIP